MMGADDVVKRIADGVTHIDKVVWAPWDAERVYPFEVAGASGEAWVKVLAREPETGAESLLYRLEPGWSAEAITSTAPENLLVLEGEITVGANKLSPMSYSYRPPGYTTGPCSTEQGALVISFAGMPHDSQVSSVAVDALDTEGMPWSPYLDDDERESNYWIKMLRADEVNLQTYFLLKARGWPESELKPYRRPDTVAMHEPPEEAFFLSGRTMLYDGLTDAPILLTKGTFVYRPANSIHRTMHLFEEQITFSHNWFAPGYEGQDAAQFSRFPIETPVVKAAKEGRIKYLHQRW